MSEKRIRVEATDKGITLLDITDAKNPVPVTGKDAEAYLKETAWELKLTRKEVIDLITTVNLKAHKPRLVNPDGTKRKQRADMTAKEKLEQWMVQKLGFSKTLANGLDKVKSLPRVIAENIPFNLRADVFDYQYNRPVTRGKNKADGDDVEGL